MARRGASGSAHAERVIEVTPRDFGRIAAQTAFGAAKLLIANKTHPEEEIDKVTSPKGCTIAGLNEMEHQGLSSALIKGIKLSSTIANQLYQET